MGARTLRHSRLVVAVSLCRRKRLARGSDGLSGLRPGRLWSYDYGYRSDREGHSVGGKIGEQRAEPGELDPETGCGQVLPVCRGTAAPAWLRERAHRIRLHVAEMDRRSARSSKTQLRESRPPSGTGIRRLRSSARAGGRCLPWFLVQRRGHDRDRRPATRGVC